MKYRLQCRLCKQAGLSITWTSLHPVFFLLNLGTQFLRKVLIMLILAQFPIATFKATFHNVFWRIPKHDLREDNLCFSPVDGVAISTAKYASPIKIWFASIEIVNIRFVNCSDIYFFANNCSNIYFFANYDNQFIRNISVGFSVILILDKSCFYMFCQFFGKFLGDDSF
jgi:hypothetical protein